MLYRVLKAFPHADDGITVVQRAVGDEISVHPLLVDGLVAAGHIQPANGKAKKPKDDEAATTGSGDGAGQTSGGSPPPVEIPEGWASLPWIKLQALVKAISGKQPKDKAAAVEAVEAAIAARAAG